MHVLVVEDDPSIADPLLAGLARAGFTVTHAATGRAALDAPTADCILLDLGLPDIDGIDVCRHLRAAGRVPIIVVSARGDELDRVMLLELGADDYVVKPFGMRELVARIRAVARRANAVPDPAPEVLDAGRLQIDLRTRRVTVDGTEIELTPKEFDVLALLTAEPGTVFTRQRILETVWDAHWYGPTKTLDVHIASVRRKLAHPEWIETVRGVGFRLETTTEAPAPDPTTGGPPDAAP
jgi:two-component system, OmpR family, response regulator RegX3